MTSGEGSRPAITLRTLGVLTLALNSIQMRANSGEASGAAHDTELQKLREEIAKLKASNRELKGQLSASAAVDEERESA